ncbi:ABC transporter ATP-binding protein [Microbacterium sp. cf332]|uniref:ABC transporter ATP-binding protein n=1 Tax=Microbacterium sp. cf332 TaxID=1761804 RepID=UPI000881ABA3|nr:ATP-binding cassette domain-containing protein [Microbacterium sp. cf332]SDQ53132.1 peptide/nickel transport system ATP-binding protein [Microbacterium sp. cf332]
MSAIEAIGLRKTYGTGRGAVEAVKGVDLAIDYGQTVALVGESGSGKSTIAKMLLLLEQPSGGELLLDGEKPPTRGRAAREYRTAVQMVFQDPFASLNPFHSIYHHIARPLVMSGRARGRAQVQRAAAELLERVQLDPDEYLHRRPHELSGGQRQRVAIARALAPAPRVLIADEPVSMLDVSIRLGVLRLLADIQQQDELAVLYITHDLATARHFSDEILVMYHGEIVERGPADGVILHPQHAYTQRLADAAPDPHRRFADVP